MSCNSFWSQLNEKLCNWRLKKVEEKLAEDSLSRAAPPAALLQPEHDEISQSSKMDQDFALI